MAIATERMRTERLWLGSPSPLSWLVELELKSSFDPTATTAQAIPRSSLAVELSLLLAWPCLPTKERHLLPSVLTSHLPR